MALTGRESSSSSGEVVKRIFVGRPMTSRRMEHTLLPIDLPSVAVPFDLLACDRDHSSRMSLALGG